MLRGVVYRLIESLASMGHSSIWKLICAISVCYTLTASVHLSSTRGISGSGSATDFCATVKTVPREVLWMTLMDFCPRPKANGNSEATFKLYLRKTFSTFY